MRCVHCGQPIIAKSDLAVGYRYYAGGFVRPYHIHCFDELHKQSGIVPIASIDLEHLSQQKTWSYLLISILLLGLIVIFTRVNGISLYLLVFIIGAVFAYGPISNLLMIRAIERLSA